MSQNLISIHAVLCSSLEWRRSRRIKHSNKCHFLYIEFAFYLIGYIYLRLGGTALFLLFWFVWNYFQALKRNEKNTNKLNDWRFKEGLKKLLILTDCIKTTDTAINGLWLDRENWDSYIAFVRVTSQSLISNKQNAIPSLIHDTIVCLKWYRNILIFVNGIGDILI